MSSRLRLSWRLQSSPGSVAAVSNLSFPFLTSNAAISAHSALLHKQPKRPNAIVAEHCRSFSTVAATTKMCNETPSTASTTSSSSCTGISTPVPTKQRSKQEIARLVQQRVQERDQWLVDGVPQEKPSHTKEMGQFVGDVLPKFLRFQPPTQEFLDEHFPVQPINWKRLENPPAPQDGQIQMTWMGHATILIQMNGCTILTDPVFSQRCAPTQWNGPKRIRPTPCSIAELCQHLLVDLVLISHNHYDHLDYQSIREIHQCSPATSFVVPLGLKAWIQQKISKQAVVHELDWNEHVVYSYSPISITTSHRNTIRIISVPMRHWSSRIGLDRDKTLWCGYSLVTQPTLECDNASDNNNTQMQQQRVLFPGDTAWFDGLDDLVGQPYGPFDVAAIPIGAYEPREFMKRNHINVEEAVRMKDAIQAKYAVPIHWGTFPLTVEPFLEPREQLVELMKDREDAGSFDPWRIGETKQFQSAADDGL